ncbi:hypothetical protein LAZ67_4000132 [Cordylochernes scorpioides]|uniref:Uncharacterized protein n=1 Tax=Cordylochernes scorpioides TaxID=51811 RepID=A0ABY6KB61_9ARAC|nr:hypothetical protein LAZ67_4000132 [Cordylochernes scorpioides]
MVMAWSSRPTGKIQDCSITPRRKGFCISQGRQVLNEITFMKDGGPPHISRGAKQLPKDTFGENRVISRHFIYQSPPRSPDLTPCDFWLWGTGQGRCAELMKLWGYTKDPNCACNVPQSMSHILDDCPLYKFNGGISNLHSVTPEALNWLKALPLRL